MIPCDICKKEFKSIHSMKMHRRWHDVPENKNFLDKKRKPYYDRAWLYDQYWNKKKHIYQIAEECGVTFAAVQTFLVKFDIKRRKIRFKKGNQAALGMKHSEELKKRFSEERKGENNYFWDHIEEDASYIAIHNYVNRRKKRPKECPECGEKRKLELSFDHDLGKETRNPEDYLYLCRSCHFKRDYKEFNIGRWAK